MPNLSLLLTVTIFILAIIVARSVYPAKNKRGIEFNDSRPSSSIRPSIEVATYNIQTGKNLQGDRDIRRAAELLANVDIAGVQEVYGAGWLNKFGIGKSQTVHLADAGNFSHLFAATRWRWFREQRGNATLAKLPVEKWEIVMLPDQSRKSPRNMTITHVSWQGEVVIFINTHLHTGRGRTQQLETVIREFKRHPKAILVGDFNTKSQDPILQPLLNDPEVTDAIAAAGLTAEGDQRIDWILTKGFLVKEGRQVLKGVSDHPFFAVTLY